MTDAPATPAPEPSPAPDPGVTDVENDVNAAAEEGLDALLTEARTLATNLLAHLEKTAAAYAAKHANLIGDVEKFVEDHI
jgi:hypothetical protein